MYIINLKKRTVYNPNDSLRSVFWGLILQYACALAFMLAVYGLNANAEISSNMQFWMSGLGVIGLALSVVIYSNTAFVDFVSATKINVKPRLSYVVAGLIGVIGLILLLSPVSDFIEQLFVSWGYVPTDLVLTNDVNGIVTAIVCAVILPCFCEELLMRGIIANGMSRYGWIKASLFSGVVFMLFHMSPSQTVYQFALGFCMSALMLRSGSLWTAIIMHFANNAIAIILSFTMSDQLYQAIFGKYFYLAMLGGAILVGIAILIVAKSRNYFSVNAELDAAHSSSAVMPEPQQQPTIDKSQVFAELSNSSNDKDDFYSQIKQPQPQQTVLPIQTKLVPVTNGSKFTFALCMLFCIAMWIVAFLGV